MIVRYVARFIGEAPGELDITETHEDFGVPRPGDHVCLHYGYCSFGVHSITLRPGIEWIVELKMHSGTARKLKDELT